MSPKQLRIFLVSGVETSSLREWRFEGDETVLIGRSEDCDIRLNHPNVSRRHATLEFRGEEWLCSAIGSNGTYLEGATVPSVALQSGMVLRFSEHGPELQFETAASPAPAAEEAESAGDVTIWLNQLQQGDNDATQHLWEQYFDQIVALARRRLSPQYRRVTDEEDVALSVMQSLFQGVSNGRYPELASRDNLWRLLVVMTARKAINAVDKARAQKRGGGAVRGESVFASPDSSFGGGFDRVSGGARTPEFLAELAEESERQLDQLQDETLQQIALMKMEGFTNEEIADQLNTTTRTVERKLQRIRELWSEAKP